MSLECGVCWQGITGQYFTTSRGQILCLQHGTAPVCEFCGLLINGSGAQCSDCAESGTHSTKDLARAAQPVLHWITQATGVQWLRDVPIRLAASGSLPNSILGLTTTLTSGILIAHDVAIRPELPQADTQEAIAHELGHVLLTTNINKYEPIPDEISIAPTYSEGFCEVIRVLWINQSRRSDASWRQERAMNNRDPVYGEGLRQVWEIFTQMQMSIMDTRTQLFRIAIQSTTGQPSGTPAISPSSSHGHCDPIPPPIQRPTLSLATEERGSHQPPTSHPRPRIQISKNA